MTENTNIVRWKPYTVIVTRDDEVLIYDKTWEETMDFIMEHGFLVLPRYKMTVQKWHIKKSFEVNNKTHTSVENWIYSQPQEWCTKLLREHRDRKWLNWYGIKSIEMWQKILDRLMWKPEKTAEESKNQYTPIDKQKAIRALKGAQKKMRKQSQDQ